MQRGVEAATRRHEGWRGGICSLAHSNLLCRPGACPDRTVSSSRPARAPLLPAARSSGRKRDEASRGGRRRRMGQRPSGPRVRPPARTGRPSDRQAAPGNWVKTWRGAAQRPHNAVAARARSFGSTHTHAHTRRTSSAQHKQSLESPTDQTPAARARAAARGSLGRRAPEPGCTKARRARIPPKLPRPQLLAATEPQGAALLVTAAGLQADAAAGRDAALPRRGAALLAVLPLALLAVLPLAPPPASPPAATAAGCCCRVRARLTPRG